MIYLCSQKQILNLYRTGDKLVMSIIPPSIIRVKIILLQRIYLF